MKKEKKKEREGARVEGREGWKKEGGEEGRIKIF